MAKLFFQCLAIFEAENFLIIVNLFAKVGCQFSPKFLHHPLNYCRWLSVSCHSGEISPNPVTLDVYQVMKKEVVVVVAVHMHIWMVFGACRLPRTPWAGPTSHSECQVEGLKGPERNGGERKIIAFEGLNVSLSQIFLSLPHSLSHWHKHISSDFLSLSFSLPPSLSFPSFSFSLYLSASPSWYLFLSPILFLSFFFPLSISLIIYFSLSFTQKLSSVYVSLFFFLRLCLIFPLILTNITSLFLPFTLWFTHTSSEPLSIPQRPSLSLSLSLSLSHTHTHSFFSNVCPFLSLYQQHRPNCFSHPFTQWKTFASQNGEKYFFLNQERGEYLRVFVFSKKSA